MVVLVANRGEIARRIARAAGVLQADVQFVHAADEQPLDETSVALPLAGPEAYLDAQSLIAVARDTGATFVHPGYGFLSENSDFARAVGDASLTFVGPDPAVLDLFGNKSTARDHAVRLDVPVLASTRIDPEPEEVADLLSRFPAGIMVKAVSGGGGRGMRPVTDPADLEDTVARCRSEALRAFGNDAIYAERLMARAKHVEVQVLSDGETTVAIGDRECSVQRQRQKVIEFAPCPGLTPEQRERLWADAIRLVDTLDYRGVATVEFLLDAERLAAGELDHVFIEVNPRLQVEHTVTEEVCGADIVVAQLRLARGESIGDLDLPAQVSDARSVGTDGLVSIQCRVNAEQLAGAAFVATTGTIEALKWPEGTRVETYVRPGTRITGRFDSLIAKIIVTTRGSVTDAFAEARRAVEATRIDGVASNLAFLSEILADPEISTGAATTSHLDDLVALRSPTTSSDADTVTAAMSGTVVDIAVSVGQVVGPRTVLATVEAMKMEHPVLAGRTGVVASLEIAIGDQVAVGDQIAQLGEAALEHEHEDDAVEPVDLDVLRPDLAAVEERRALTRDEARPRAVEKRHSRGHLTAREQIGTLVDDDSFVEYGAFPVAAQRGRRSLDELITTTPADGIITGVARINGDTAADGGECVVPAYDYTVLAGTQGYFNHKKTDRILEIAHRRQVPVVFFTEGGGGRPGDVDADEIISSGLTVETFATMGSLSGTVPTVGVLTGRCFAGNAALLGCCDVIIATRDSHLGMAGPAMIEGGGLGRFTPEEIGPMEVHGVNGVVDLVVEDDAAAISATQQYLSYFQGPAENWERHDQRLLRHAVGENRKQVYDIRHVIEVLADVDSVLELRRGFGAGIVTALVRIEGRPMGLVANDPAHLGGAIDADGADKFARFLQLCDAHGLPVVSLCDTPGFMVGPDSEKQATVRHFSRLFIIGAHLLVPVVTVVLRKAYGLGAQAMAGGSFVLPAATIAWPSGEMGGMGLEGAVRLGYAKELAALEDPAERQRRFDELVDAHYDSGTAMNGAMKQELDDVIDPADTCRWIVAAFGSSPQIERSGRYVDAW